MAAALNIYLEFILKDGAPISTFNRSSKQSKLNFIIYLICEITYQDVMALIKACSA